MAKAAEPCTPVVGRLASAEGEIEVRRADVPRWQPAGLDEDLCEGDAVRAGRNSRAAIALINDAVLRLDQNTTIQLTDITAEEEERSFFDLVAGVIQSFSRAPRLLAVNTPYLNATIEGTEFVIEVAANQSEITVLEGVVRAANDFGEIRVASGEAALAEAGEAPRQVIVVTPRDAVQWALYYPPILAVRAAPAEPLPPTLAEALDLAAEGRTSAAIAALDEVPEAERDERFHVYRASLLLSVGQVEEAEQALERALMQDADFGPAYALRSIIEVVQNEKEEALADAERAVELAPEAVAPKIALSYALQANFELEAARDVLLEAVEQNPNDPLAWARLAELYLSLGGREQAREAAERAVELASASRATAAARGSTEVAAATFRPVAAGEPSAHAGAAGSSDAPNAPGMQLAQAAAEEAAEVGERSPELERALVVLGFANLAEFDTAEAKENFARAIALDPADPLPHFGYGLAQIREGDLEEGRENVEVAVALNANSSILRSYLGKAYFEEKRIGLAEEQYALAKELDPLDPTPYLYDALLDQTENRPVEALHDLQTSIELNDNRAVYRSRLQLDEDRAARGTSIARIYDDLGFTELGVQEASRSVSLDPGNASAHRFRSDVFRDVRRQETTRVSELLQAQMLQHININPIQPSVSETNLNIVTQGGPAEVGFNEFTPLFERNQVQLNASAALGNDNTFSGEGVASALYDRYSLSAGYFYYETDGWRDNNQIQHNIANVFGQVAITPDLNVQIEVTDRDSTEGDLDFNFDPDDFFPQERFDVDQTIARVGLRYSPSPNSDLLFSLAYADLETEQTDAADTEFGPFEFEQTTEDKGFQGEAQHILQLDRLNTIAGIAVSDFDRDFRSLQTIGGFPLVDIDDDDEPVNNVHPYIYGNLNLPDSVIWTLGLASDNLEREEIEVNTVSPKFGVQWLITDDLTLRGAAFQVVRPALANSRTLEPTQLAGFNQFFDEADGTESRRYGVGLDWEATDDLFLGAEGTWRDIDFPIFSVSQGLLFLDHDEQLHRAYAYWTPFPQLALSAEFVYDLFKAEQSLLTDFSGVPTEVEAYKIPLGARYFHPIGLFAGVTGTFVRQRVERSPTSLVGGAEGESDFFIVDAAIGYRFPKRFGVASFEVNNLFDQQFRFQDDSFRQIGVAPSVGPFIPERQFLARIALNW